MVLFGKIHRTFAVRQGLAIPGGLDTHPAFINVVEYYYSTIFILRFFTPSM